MNKKLPIAGQVTLLRLGLPVPARRLHLTPAKLLRWNNEFEGSDEFGTAIERSAHEAEAL